MGSDQYNQAAQPSAPPAHEAGPFPAHTPPPGQSPAPSAQGVPPDASQPSAPPAPREPIARFADGALFAHVWENAARQEGKLPTHNVETGRHYQDNRGEWRISHHYKGTELLRMGRLLEKSHDFVVERTRQLREHMQSQKPRSNTRSNGHER